MPSPARTVLQNLTAASRPHAEICLTVRNLTRDSLLATHVRIADRGPARRKGLLGRASLPPHEGLWIVPCEAVHTLGMQFPIDLIYLDRNSLVKKVRSSVPPWRLSACLSAHSILELAAGTILASRTRPGDKLALSAFAPDSQA